MFIEEAGLERKQTKRKKVPFLEREREITDTIWNVMVSSIAIAGMQNQALVKKRNSVSLVFLFDRVSFLLLIDPQKLV